LFTDQLRGERGEDEGEESVCEGIGGGGKSEREEEFAILRVQLDFVAFEDQSQPLMSELLYFCQVCYCVLQCVAVLLQYCLKTILLLSDLLCVCPVCENLHDPVLMTNEFFIQLRYELILTVFGRQSTFVNPTVVQFSLIPPHSALSSHPCLCSPFWRLLSHHYQSPGGGRTSSRKYMAYA